MGKIAKYVIQFKGMLNVIAVSSVLSLGVLSASTVRAAEIAPTPVTPKAVVNQPVQLAYWYRYHHWYHGRWHRYHGGWYRHWYRY